MLFLSAAHYAAVLLAVNIANAEAQILGLITGGIGIVIGIKAFGAILRGSLIAIAGLAVIGAVSLMLIASPFLTELKDYLLQISH
ncbi:MAG: hypothetical protein M3Z97_14305 [Candidatus Dormibacteraeota bacterium]|nr:hypothetical protein [Candidatus Dormibacteraeota bacterium]